jgi:hypothetical protein
VKAEFTNHSHFNIIKFLYQFKDDNKFYKLDEQELNLESKKETYRYIYNLRNDALICTDREVYQIDEDYYSVENFGNTEEIRAKILPKGIAVMESLQEKKNTLVSEN